MRASPRSLFLALALWAAPTVAAAGPAADLIGAMGDEAKEMLRATEGDLGMRETALRAGLVNDFDMDYIARFALGDYWTRATADQQADYLNMFGAYVVATYARRLGGYAGDELSIVGEEAAGPNDVLVTTHVTRGDAAPIEAEWRVRAAEDAPARVIDVRVDGVSLLARAREEFAGLVRQHGIDGLIEILRARAGRLGAQ